MASDNSTEPASLPSSVVIFNFISHALLLGGRRISGSGFVTAAVGDLELARLRRVLRQRLFHRVAHRDPAALGAGNGAFDQDQAAFNIGLYDTQVKRGD